MVGDVVVVGPYHLVVSLPQGAAPRLQVLDTRNRARLDAREVTVKAGARTILDRISLSLPAGSFTAIIGPSGSGKSTLLRALSGARPASTGQVLLNGVDLYRAFSALKSHLGYVPQDDIVHRELTVDESLDYTARLRLPRDTRAPERVRRVSEVLATLELTERRTLEVHSLSGGQRKRVSIAAELLTEPNLLFLDEPTSGLDPGLEESLMLLLRELSYKGKTVVLVTHTLDNIHLCDAVLLMVDGRLGFYGTPDEARAYFGIEHMVNLYARLKERPGADWHDQFQQTEVHARRVAQPLQVVSRATPGAEAAAPAPRRIGPLRQLRLLTTRYLRMTGRDTRNGLLLILQAPIIAGLIGLSLLYGSSEIAYTKPKNTLLFLLALTAVWFGCSNAARELVKERPIYLRERMVNLRILPYLLSKVVVLGALALVQCVAFLAILHEWFFIPGHLPLLLGAMMLSSLVGILMGLALSAVAGTADRAMTLLPILLIPQVLFTSPSVHMDMKGPAGYVARAMPTWWSFDLLRRIAIEPDAALHDDSILARLDTGARVLMTRDRFESMLGEGYMLFQYRSGIETTWTSTVPERLAARVPVGPEFWRPALVDTAALGGFALLFLGIATVAQRRHDRLR
jgi:ABC-type multidrug transport system ATPase subunit